MGEAERCVILGVPVHAVDMAGALEWVSTQVRQGRSPSCVLAVNPEKVYHLRENTFLRGFFDNAGLCVPDGIGMVIALRWLRGRKVSRVPGADLMQEICRQAEALGHRVFLYGASEEVSAGAMAKLMVRHPGLMVVGRANGFVKPEDQDGLIGRINASQAEILFVAMGSPRQEKWVAENLARLSHVRVIQCIGGTLDTIDGRVKRAPKIFQRLGLEWFYRLLKQPSRISRQLKLGLFALEVFFCKFTRSKANV